MAYFDNPEKAARWERELSALRAERERRQASPHVLNRHVGLSLSPAAITRAAFGMARVAEAKVWSPPVRPPSPAFERRPRVPIAHGEPITFAELVAELEEAIPDFVFTPEPEPEHAPTPPEAYTVKTAKLAIERIPVTFAELMAEAGMPAKAAKLAERVGMSLAPTQRPAQKSMPELITFSQLKAEAERKQAV